MKKFVLFILLLLLAIPAEAAAPVVARTRASGLTVTLTTGIPIDYELVDPRDGTERYANSVQIFNATGSTLWINLTGRDVTGTKVSANTSDIKIISTDTVYGPLVFDPLFTARISVTNNAAYPISSELRMWFLFEE